MTQQLIVPHNRKSSRPYKKESIRFTVTMDSSSYCYDHCYLGETDSHKVVNEVLISNFIKERVFSYNCLGDVRHRVSLDKD